MFPISYFVYHVNYPVCLLITHLVYSANYQQGPIRVENITDIRILVWDLCFTINTCQLSG